MEKAVKSKALKAKCSKTPYTSRFSPDASRFTPMNQTDQFNIKCGDQTPDFDFLIPLIERQKSLIHPCRDAFNHNA